jgi:hypothetical protein
LLDILNEAEWKKVFSTYDKWWKRELDRPVMHLVFYGKKSDKKCPELQGSLYHTYYDPTFPIEKIVDLFEYQISSTEYVLDSFPSYQMDFGAGVNAGFLGCRVEVSPYTVWFEAENKLDPKELKLEYRNDSPIYKRIIDLYKACFNRFGDSVIPGCQCMNCANTECQLRSCKACSSRPKSASQQEYIETNCDDFKAKTPLVE